MVDPSGFVVQIEPIKPPENQAHCIVAGEKFVKSRGFDADRKVILLNKLLKAKEDGTIANKPKLTALYAWFETVQGLAIAGKSTFPAPPHTFEEVVAE